jgi:hypothetical protein
LHQVTAYDDCDPEAVLALGEFYANDDCTSPEGMRLIIRAAESGYPAALLLAFRLQRDRDPKRALSWLQQVASMGLPEAQTELGKAYEEGLVNGIPEISQALQWYKKASAQSDVCAQFQLYLVLGRDQQIGTQEFANASRWLRLAADHGYAPAQYRLGKLLLELTEVQKLSLNMGKSNGLTYLDMAAEQGHFDAALDASHFRIQNDTEADKAFIVLDKVTKNGCSSSLTYLVNLLLEPLLPLKDKALEYLHLAPKSDHYAQFVKCALALNMSELTKLDCSSREKVNQV